MTNLLNVADVRTEGQTRNLLAYDVGESVFGSRKDIAALRKEFQETIGKKTVSSIMERLESINPGLAAQYCIKGNILPKFDFEKERKQGTDVHVAILKKLLLERISVKPTGSDALTRGQYINAIEEINLLLSKVKTLDQFKQMRSNLRQRMQLEKPTDLAREQRFLASAEMKLLGEPTPSDLARGRYIGNGKYEELTADEWRKKCEENIIERKEKIAQYYVNFNKPLYVLGEKFCNFFLNDEKGRSTITKVLSRDVTWDVQQPAATKKERVTRGAKRKEWERKVEDPYYRSGGRKVSIEKPEEAIIQFSLRAVQFGHWLDDSSGKFHLVKTAEAFQDLADLLRLSDKEISLGGKLSISFGARGSGGKAAALAHYEPAMKIINMTKERSPGSLAHEYGHFLDNQIHGLSMGYDTIGFGSEELGSLATEDIQKAYQNLVNAILEGDGTNPYTIKVLNQNRVFRRIYPSRRNAVQSGGLTLEVIRYFSDQINKECDAEKERTEDRLTLEKKKAGHTNVDSLLKKLKQIESKRNRELNTLYQELMYHYQRHTGECVEHIEVPKVGSMYVNRMRERDGGGKPYYSTIVEMFARCFESWVEHELSKRGLRNNYLVCGTTEMAVNLLGAPFPEGIEREIIFNHMEALMQAVASSGILNS